MPGDAEPPYEALTALVASLRRELAEAAGALEQVRAELAEARGRITELGARLKQNPTGKLLQAALERGQAGCATAVAAQAERS